MSEQDKDCCELLEVGGCWGDHYGLTKSSKHS